MGFFLFNYSVLMILGATTGCGGKAILGTNEGIQGGDVSFGNVEEM